MDEKKLKILIIDDDEDTRIMYTEVFKKANFQVAEAFDGLDGLDKATKETPDLIFTGIIMPRMDGFQLKEALSKNVATADIPVFMNSHMGREEDKKRASEMGIKDFFVRGMITPKEVMERVRIMFGNSAKGYKLKINITELDAPELIADFNFAQGFTCKNCGTEMVLNILMTDVKQRGFTGKIICPNCGTV